MGIMPITAKKFSYPNLGFKPKAYTTQGLPRHSKSDMRSWYRSVRRSKTRAQLSPASQPLRAQLDGARGHLRLRPHIGPHELLARTWVIERALTGLALA